MDLVIGVLAGIIAQELWACMPSLADLIVRRAVDRLPSNEQKRWLEEFMAALDRSHSPLLKVIEACECWLAAAKMSIPSYPRRIWVPAPRKIVLASLVGAVVVLSHSSMAPEIESFSPNQVSTQIVEADTNELVERPAAEQPDTKSHWIKGAATDDNNQIVGLDSSFLSPSAHQNLGIPQSDLSNDVLRDDGALTYEQTSLLQQAGLSRIASPPWSLPDYTKAWTGDGSIASVMDPSMLQKSLAGVPDYTAALKPSAGVASYLGGLVGTGSLYQPLSANPAYIP